METSPATKPPLLLRNLVTSVVIFADESLLNLSDKYKLLETFRCIFLSCFFFFLRFFSSFSLLPIPVKPNSENFALKPSRNDRVPLCYGGGGDSSIARALSQLLSTVNDVPVSSRKYQLVRSLAESIIDENHREGVPVLREVNRTVLLAAFSRTLSQLETAVLEREPVTSEDSGGSASRDVPVQVEYMLIRVLKAVRSVGAIGWRWSRRVRGEPSRCGVTVEKLAAELLWLAQKLTACGYGEDAVRRWATASNLGLLAFSAEPRVQGSLVKVAVLLFKEATNLGIDETEETKIEEDVETKLKLMESWLPLLCRGSNGTDAPILSLGERDELQRILEETVEEFEEDEQEKVLSLWLHHFTRCPSSDWPNLHACYARWCTASRKQLLLQ
ncbi:hypothetical protein L6164_036333 [Bauhinia variegata]|uniref:Uncharacterized protein n=1 Tax=Bauhinia variegata TaxID=167791 RepID=A0ACB9KGP8_BAUVA|nr:hypothetical protein L6164_036333 [Bauhinia variegata]